MPFVPVAELKDYVGKELGKSEWLTIDQQRINQFAECTGDHQFIHVDPEKAKLTPFGTTIAHGFFVLSLMAGMTDGSNVEITGAGLIINYGADKLRFVTPVPSGSHIHMHSRIADVRQRGGGSLVKAEYEIWVVGADRPALFYRPLSLFLPEAVLFLPEVVSTREKWRRI